jgi:hypothetical protein
MDLQHRRLHEKLGEPMGETVDRESAAEEFKDLL